jgi:hypothetical protein
MILDAKKDHLIPHVSEKKTTKEMFDALVSLYQSQDSKHKQEDGIAKQTQIHSYDQIRHSHQLVNMQELSFFSRPSSRPRIRILRMQYGSLRHSESFGSLPG